MLASFIPKRSCIVLPEGEMVFSLQVNEDSGNRRPIMLETANANSNESRRGDSENSSSGGAVAGEKRTGEETSSQSSQDKASKKMKKCKQDADTSGNVNHGQNCFPGVVAYFSCKQDI